MLGPAAPDGPPVWLSSVKANVGHLEVASGMAGLAKVMLELAYGEIYPQAHFTTTGPEIFRDCPEVTHFVAGMGTSGTLIGVGSYLKSVKPSVEVWAVEPPSGEQVDGLRSLDDGYIPPIFTDNNGFDLLDRKKVIGARESIEWTRRMVRETGVFAGLSSGAIMAAAAKCAAEIDEGVIVTIVCDAGWKYLSTGAYAGDLDEVTENAKKVIYF